MNNLLQIIMSPILLRIMLCISALTPLPLVSTINNGLHKVAYKYELYFFLASLIISVIVVYTFFYFQVDDQPDDPKINNISSMQGEFFPFLMTYLSPFFGSPTDKWGFITLYLVIFIIFYFSELYYFNIIFLLFKLKFYKLNVQMDGYKFSCDIILLSRKNLNLHINYSNIEIIPLVGIYYYHFTKRGKRGQSKNDLS